MVRGKFMKMPRVCSRPDAGDECAPFLMLQVAYSSLLNPLDLGNCSDTPFKIAIRNDLTQDSEVGRREPFNHCARVKFGDGKRNILRTWRDFLTPVSVAIRCDQTAMYSWIPGQVVHEFDYDHPSVRPMQNAFRSVFHSNVREFFQE